MASAPKPPSWARKFSSNEATALYDEDADTLVDVLLAVDDDEAVEEDVDVELFAARLSTSACLSHACVCGLAPETDKLI